MGVVLSNYLNAMFIEFVEHEAMTLGHLKRRLADQTRPLARFLRSSGSAGEG